MYGCAQVKATNAYRLNLKSKLDSKLRFVLKGSDFSNVWECGDLKQLLQSWQWPECLRVRALAVQEITWDFWVWELWPANNTYIGTEWERHKKTYVRTGQAFKWFSFKMKRSDWMRLASGELFVHLPIKEGDPCQFVLMGDWLRACLCLKIGDWNS